MGLGLSEDGYVKMIIEMFAADVNIVEKKLSIQMLKLDRGKITLTSSKLKGPWEKDKKGKADKWKHVDIRERILKI